MINASEWLVPDGKTDNLPLWERMMDAALVSATIRIPDGSYFFSGTIELTKPLIIEGESNTVKFIFPQGCTGLHIYGTSGYKPVWKNVHLIADGQLQGKGRSQDPDAYKFHGIFCEAVANIEDSIIQGFNGHGLCISADVGNKPPSNASHCYIRNVVATRNSGCGFYVQGNDANMVEHHHCDARDNGLNGFHDASFLGCNYFSCMAHANFRAYMQTNANAASVFAGCYSEGGQNPSVLMSTRAVFIGGQHESAVTGAGFINIHGISNKAFVNSVVPRSNLSIGFARDEKEDKVAMHFGSTGGGFSRLESQRADIVHYSQQFQNAQFNVWSFGQAGAVLTQHNQKRSLRSAAHGFAHLFIGRTFFCSAQSIDPKDLPSISWLRGDEIRNENYNGLTPVGWRCISPGVFRPIH
jgi:hypothetical protein